MKSRSFSLQSAVVYYWVNRTAVTMFKLATQDKMRLFIYLRLNGVYHWIKHIKICRLDFISFLSLEPRSLVIYVQKKAKRESHFATASSSKPKAIKQSVNGASLLRGFWTCLHCRNCRSYHMVWPPLLRTYTSHQKQKHRVCVSQCQSVSCSIAYAEGVSRSSLLCPDSSNCLQILPNPVDLHLEYSKCAPSSTGSASSSVYSVTAWVLQTVDIWAKWKLQTNPCNGEILLNARNPHLFTFVSVLWPVVYCGTPVPHISIKPSSFHHGWHAPTW